MRSLSLKKVGAIAAGAAMLTSAISGAALAATVDSQATSPAMYSRSTYLDDTTNAVAVQIVLGSTAAISDGVAAAKLAAKLGSIAYKSTPTSASCTLGGATGVTCSTPSLSGSVTVSASTAGGEGAEEVNEVGRTGILLEENVSTATTLGLAAGKSYTMEAGEVDFLSINSFGMNDTDKTGTERLIVNPDEATGPSNAVVLLKYDEENDSDPRWQMILGTGLVQYKQEYEPQLILYTDATSQLTATFTDRVPVIPIAGVDLSVKSLQNGEWKFSAANSQVFDTVSEDDPPVTFGDWSIQVTDVFDDGAGNWYASLTVTHAGAYQSHVMQTGQQFTYGKESQFGGAELTITLNTAVGKYASFNVVTGGTAEVTVGDEDDWMDDANWTTTAINQNETVITYKPSSESEFYKFNEGGKFPALNNYWNMEFVQFVYPTSYELSFTADDGGAMDVTYYSRYGPKTFDVDEYYAEYPEVKVSKTSGAGIAYEEGLSDYDAGDAGFPAIPSANLLRLNQTKWKGVIIGDRIYSWTIVSEDNKNKLELCYELTGTAETCLAKAENNTVKEAQVPFYNVQNGEPEDTYSYYFMYNGTGNKNIYLFWDDNTSVTAYPPANIRMKGLGSMVLNTSMQGSATKANNTVTYTDAVGDWATLTYDPDDTDKGWDAVDTSDWLGDGISTNQDEVNAVDRLDYTPGLGTKYEVSSSGKVLTVTTYKDPVKVQYWVGGTRTSGTEGGVTTATFTGTGTKSGITVSAFAINPVNCQSYCTASFGGGTGSVNYTARAPFVPGVSTLVVLDSASITAPTMITIGGQLVNSKTAAAGVSLTSADTAVVTVKSVGGKTAIVAAGYTASGTADAVNELINILDTYVKAS